MKALNMALLTVGVVLLAFGYVPWLTRHESVELRSAQNAMTVLAGWALTVMGYLGMLITSHWSRRDAQDLQIEVPRQRRDE
jgi:hypothetical protein